MKWQQKFTGRWQVRTESDRLVGSYCSAEYAEQAAEQGKVRTTYQWLNGKYHPWYTYHKKLGIRTRA